MPLTWRLDAPVTAVTGQHDQLGRTTSPHSMVSSSSSMLLIDSPLRSEGVANRLIGRTGIVAGAVMYTHDGHLPDLRGAVRLGNQIINSLRYCRSLWRLYAHCQCHASRYEVDVICGNGRPCRCGVWRRCSHLNTCRPSLPQPKELASRGGVQQVDVQQ